MSSKTVFSPTEPTGTSPNEFEAIEELRKMDLYFMKMDGIRQEMPPIKKPAMRGHSRAVG